MREPRILIFGDSHAHALQEAARRRVAEGKPVHADVRRLLKVKKHDKTLGDTEFEDFLAMASALTPADVVVSAIGGNQHAVFSTIQHPVAFDFFLAGEQSEAATAPIIPFHALKDAFSAGMRTGDGRSLEAIRKATDARLIHLLAPPPKADNAFIQNYHDTRFAAANIEARGVSPPALRMKFWCLQNIVIEEICRELDIEVMAPPAEALDADGFLTSDYYANDATHANPAYGDLVLTNIEARFLPESGDAAR